MPKGICRREFLRGGASLLSLTGMGLLIPKLARASTSDRCLIIYWNQGGWDPSYVFDPHFESTALDRDPSSVAAQIDGLDFADAESRPSVRAFLEDYASQTAFVNGIAIGSISHSTCTRLMLTGSRKEEASDLPTLVAAATASDLILPHVVLSGPRFPGTNGHVMAPLSATLTGTASGSLPAGSALDDGAEDRIRAYLAQAAEGGVSEGMGALRAQYRESLERLDALEAAAGEISVATSSTEAEILSSGLSALSGGLSRCLMLTGGQPERLGWDSHMNNHLAQDESFEKLFDDLSTLMALLEVTPAPDGGVLADQTTVMVLSEMGRTPVMNAGDGKDHWPYTSAMVLGKGVAGGRVLGGSDEYLVGQPVDLSSGELYSGGDILTPVHLMGAVLQSFGAEPAEWLPGADYLDGLFSD
jgi:uncharacterized protein (DUF1501 family)